MFSLIKTPTVCNVDPILVQERKIEHMLQAVFVIHAHYVIGVAIRRG